MSQKKITYKAIGLYTYPNQYGAPDGAMSSASNVFIDRPGVIESARDVSATKNLAFGNSNANTFALEVGSTGLLDTYPLNFTGTTYFLVSQEASASAVGGNLFFASSAFTAADKSKLISPDTSLVDLAQRATALFEANKNVYVMCGGIMGIAARTGPAPAYKYDGQSNGSPLNPSTQPVAKKTGLGMPEPPTPTHYFASVPTGGSHGFATATPSGGITPTSNFGLPSNLGKYSRSYRVLFARKDANGNLIRSAPSARHVVYSPGNADGTQAGGQVFGIQIFGVQNLFAGDLIQVYASETVTSASNTAAANLAVPEPSDEMYQVYEYVVLAADITRSYASVNDITPDAARGPALYTNATQQGILAGEQPPPPASLACWFKNVAWYAGVSWRGYSTALLSILGTTGWTTGSGTTLTIAGVTYIANATEDLANNKFALYNPSVNGTATTSIAQMNFMTARSLCRAINYNNNLVLATLASPPNATYAQILIKSYGANGVGMGSGPGTITITGANVTIGTIASLGTNNTASPSFSTTYDGTLNRLYLSKPNQPEAVPDNNYVSVGQTNSAIVGLCGLRDSLFVFKSEGLFRVTGTTMSDVRADVFDQTVSMLPGQFKSIATAGNQIFAVCTQGVISITEAGVSVISRAIEDSIANYDHKSVDVFASTSIPYPLCGAASDEERKYILQQNVSVAAPGVSNTLWIYNFATNTWTNATNPGWFVTCYRNGVQSPFGAAAVADTFIFSTKGSASLSSMYPVNCLSLSLSPAPAFLQPSWTYAFSETENPGTLRRYIDVTIITQGSSATPATMAIQFSSDSGATPVTQTVTPTSAYGCRIMVPSSHAYCGQLQMKITGPAAGTTKLIVSEVQVSFEDAGDRVFL